MSPAKDDPPIAGTHDHALMTLDPRGNIVSWNPEALELSGYHASDIVGRHVSVLYVPEAIAAGTPLHELELAAKHGRWEGRGWRARRDGSRYQANVVITAFTDAGGALRGYRTLIRDVTDRQAHEAALRGQDHERAEVRSAATGVCIIVTDLSGMITSFNGGAERMLGYRAEDVVGLRNLALILDADELAQRAQGLGVAPGLAVLWDDPGLRAGEIVTWTYVGQGGARVAVELEVTAVLDDAQLPRGFIVVAVGRSDRERLEGELRVASEEAEIMETAFTRAPGGVALIALDGRFLRVNRALCEMLARPESELVGHTSAAFTHPDDVEVTDQALEALRAAGSQVTVEKRYVRPDGEIVHASTTGTAVQARDGRLTHTISHFRDITEQRLAQEQLRASERNLRNVAAVARGLPSHESPREAICEAALTITDADIAQFWEPDGQDHLRATASVGAELTAALRVPLSGEISATATAHRSGVRQIVTDMHAAGAPVSPGIRRHLGVSSILAEPVVTRRGVRGVLVVYWKTQITHARANDVDALGLLATEAATAIERADLTARLQVMARKDELRMRQLLEATPDAMLIFSADEVIQTVNAQSQRLLGYERHELIGQSLRMVVPDADRLNQGAGQPALDTGEMGPERDLRVVHKDGHQIPVSVTFSPVETDDGVWQIAAVRDMTDRRLAEVRLRAAEEQFRRTFDDAPIGMTIVDIDGCCLQVNDAFCAIVGYPRAALVGLAQRAITHPDDLAADEAGLRDLLSGKVRSLVVEKRLLHAAGHPVWTSMYVTVVRDAEERPDHFITQVQDITERRLYEDQLKQMADHDPLTGLLNRRSFQRELDSHVARVKRFGAVGAVLMLDLDHFKYYNDTQGHSAGDELIVRIAQTLKNRLRETDVIARLGGDEFAVLLPRETRESAEIVAQVLVKLVREQAPPPTLGEQRRVTASIGIACFADGEDVRAEEIMINADFAMYDAKENGRNGAAQYRTEQHGRPRIESQMRWGREITQALAEDRFELLAQPITSLRDERTTQYELLLRMRDSHGDQIPPGTFIYVAERLGLIQEIDRWVAVHAIGMLAVQRAAGHDLRFEVNLSGHSIGAPGLLELIEQHLQETAVPPDRLIFEITETAAVADIARAVAFAERLSELGCKFALDDFGAGFGSFYYLKHLPFDYLKIDGEYVRHCATNETDQILIAAVVQIASGMGKRTIAEFVGDQESVEVLRRLGVDYGQGYFLGRPAPLAEHLAAQASLIGRRTGPAN